MITCASACASELVFAAILLKTFLDWKDHDLHHAVDSQFGSNKEASSLTTDQRVLGASTSQEAVDRDSGLAEYAQLSNGPVDL